MKLRITAISFALLISSMSLLAQTATVIPIPAELISAHTVFVVNAGGPDNQLSQSVYKSLYATLLNAKHLQLVGSPRDADLAFEISAGLHTGSLVAGMPVHPSIIQLDIRDAKTQSLLWSLSEPLVLNPISGDVSKAVSRLVADYNTLIAGTLLYEPAPRRFSEEEKKK